MKVSRSTFLIKGGVNNFKILCQKTKRTQFGEYAINMELDRLLQLINTAGARRACAGLNNSLLPSFRNPPPNT